MMIENKAPQDPEVQRLRGQFDSLVEVVHEDVLRYARGVTRSYDLGNDMFMEGWWEMLGRYPEIEDIHPNQFRVYFQKVVRSRFYNYCNKKGRESNLGFHEERIRAPLTEFDTEPEQISDSLSQALQALSPPLREAIILQSEGQSEDVSAQMMGVSEEDFRELLSEARGKLQSTLFQPETTPEFSDNQPKLLTIGQIAERLGRQWISIVNLLSAYKDEAVIKDNNNIRDNVLFPEDILIDLEMAVIEKIPASEWFTTHKLAKLLGVSHNWIVRRVFSFPFSGELRTAENGRTTIYFPPESLTLLGEERDKVTEFAVKGVDLNTFQLAEILGKHVFWVGRRLIELQIEPTYKKGLTGKVCPQYDANALQKLQHEIEKYPPLDNYLVIPDLAAATGRDREWVENRLKELGVQSEFRTYPRTHRIFPAYNPDVLDELHKLGDVYLSPDEGWMTNRAISQTFSPCIWVNKILDQFDSAAVMRIDTQGVLRKHYPPEAFTALSEEKHKRIAKKAAKKWYEG